jgi:hypothetical protein
MQGLKTRDSKLGCIIEAEIIKNKMPANNAMNTGVNSFKKPI